MSSSKELKEAHPTNDMSAIKGFAASLPGMKAMLGEKLSSKELKDAKREFKSFIAKIKREKKAEKKIAKKKTIAQQLKERDKELTKKTKAKREARCHAKDVLSYIGYNRMYKDGICELEDGLYSQTLTFPDISYQSAREDRQKDVFNIWSGMMDYFGAETLVQIGVVNTPLLREDIGNRNFFDIEDKNDDDIAAKDAKVFNSILNDKMREGVSNIHRERYITYPIAAN